MTFTVDQYAADRAFIQRQLHNSVLLRSLDLCSAERDLRQRGVGLVMLSNGELIGHCGSFIAWTEDFCDIVLDRRQLAHFYTTLNISPRVSARYLIGHEMGHKASSLMNQAGLSNFTWRNEHQAWAVGQIMYTSLFNAMPGEEYGVLRDYCLASYKKATESPTPAPTQKIDAIAQLDRASAILKAYAAAKAKPSAQSKPQVVQTKPRVQIPAMCKVVG